MASRNWSSPSVWALFHDAREGPGIIGNAMASRKIAVRRVRTFRQERVPRQMRGAAGLILMGGPQSVYEQDRYPFLRDEIRLIQDALQKNKPVLGVCLGSQLLAAALGAEVRPGRKEIGWHRVTLTRNAAGDELWGGVKRSFTAYHWHGDVFDLPRGAVTLASSDLTACQAFRYGHNAYGILFHMEVTARMIQGMVRAFPDDLQAAGTEASSVLRRVRTCLPELGRIGSGVFARFADLVPDGVEHPHRATR